MSMSLKSYREKRTFPSIVVTICLDAALSAEKDQIQRQIFAAGERKPPALVKAMRELDDRMLESCLKIRVVGVSFAEFQKIQLAHPGRKGQQEPYNPVTFYPDVVYKTSLLVEGDVESPLSDQARSDWDAIVADLTTAEMSALVDAVDEVNGRRVNPDFLLPGSTATPDSSEISD